MYPCNSHVTSDVCEKISKSEKHSINHDTEIHYHFWHATVPYLRRLATRHSGSMNFTYWYVFLCTRYPATAFLPTQFMSIRTHHKHQYSQHLNSTNCNTKPTGLWLIGFAVIDIIIYQGSGEWFLFRCHTQNEAVYDRRTTSTWKSKIRGFLLHHLHWRIPIEKARQCTAINFGIVRRDCGVFLSGGVDNWYYLIWYWRGGKYILQFSFIVASVFMYYEWMFRKGIICIDKNIRQELETSE